MKVLVIGAENMAISTFKELALMGCDVIMITPEKIAGPELHTVALASVEQEGKKVLTYNEGLTENIISEILAVYKASWIQTKNFASHLKGATTEETCRNVWEYIRRNISYKLDPVGIQYIKTPARTIEDGFGDCKAYSILACSILQNLNINCQFRFASYSGVDVYTHVYTVANDGKKQYIIDACLPSFNEEKPYSFKLDKMTKIYRLSGISTTLVTTPFEIDPEMNAGQLSLLLMRERLELEQQIAQGLAGIGTPLDQTYNYDLALVNEALRNVNNPELISGIGAAVGKTIVGKFLQKAGNAIKKGAKAVVKVVTAPVRLAIKGILELTLPKAAPAFLYLFLTPAQLAAAPDTVKKKQGKAARKAKFITNVVGMKEEHFMAIIRNGIMKQMGRTPEQVIASQMKQIAGIGLAPLLAAAIPALMQLLQKIASLFKKQDGEPYTQADLPSEEDWGQFLTNTVENATTATPRTTSVQVPRLVESNTTTSPNGTTITVKSLQTQPASQQVTEATEGYTPDPQQSGGFQLKPWMIAAGAAGAFLLLRK